jgi:hypothetical protein
MTVIKSKINSLAWLKSAVICTSVVGGTILLSKPAASATFSAEPYESRTSIIISIQDVFGGGDDSIRFHGNYWNAFFNITETQGPFDDVLLVSMLLKHVTAPHQGEDSVGSPLTFDFRLDASSTDRKLVSFSPNIDPVTHPGTNHSDRARGTLTANLSHGFFGSDNIEGTWELTVTGEHRVPEPVTLLGTAMGLGLGGWFKRKNSIKQNKTKSQG